MTSIALAIVVAFIIYVMVWSIQNDGARSIGDQKGLIKMLDPLKKPVKDLKGTVAHESPPTQAPSPSATPPQGPSSPTRQPR